MDSPSMNGFETPSASASRMAKVILNCYGLGDSVNEAAFTDLQAEDYQVKYYKLLEESQVSQKKLIDQLHTQTEETIRLRLENKLLRTEHKTMQEKIKRARAVTGTEALAIILDGSTGRNSAATSSQVSPTVVLNANASEFAQPKAPKTVESKKPAEPIIAPVAVVVVPEPEPAVVTAVTVETTVDKDVQEIYYMHPQKDVKPANTDPLSAKLAHFNKSVSPSNNEGGSSQAGDSRRPPPRRDYDSYDRGNESRRDDRGGERGRYSERGRGSGRDSYERDEHCDRLDRRYGPRSDYNNDKDKEMPSQQQPQLDNFNWGASPADSSTPKAMKQPGQQCGCLEISPTPMRDNTDGRHHSGQQEHDERRPPRERNYSNPSQPKQANNEDSFDYTQSVASPAAAADESKENNKPSEPPTPVHEPFDSSMDSSRPPYSPRPKLPTPEPLEGEALATFDWTQPAGNGNSNGNSSDDGQHRVRSTSRLSTGGQRRYEMEGKRGGEVLADVKNIVQETYDGDRWSNNNRGSGRGYNNDRAERPRGGGYRGDYGQDRGGYGDRRGGGSDYGGRRNENY